MTAGGLCPAQAVRHGEEQSAGCGARRKGELPKESI